MKKLLLLGNNCHVDELIKYAKARGVYTIVTDNLTVEQSPVKAMADEAWDISVFDYDVLEKKCREENVTAVLCGASEVCIKANKELCERLGLPFYANEKAWDITNDKFAFKQACVECGLPVPKDYVLDINFKAEDLANIEYPVVVKPTDCFSSLGLHICQNEQELIEGYKDAYEKAEESYIDLTDKSDKFKYLSETLPEGSKARQIYEGYANELSKQADDLAKHGLNMGNRKALTGLKKRYQGEIGRLVDADIAMQEEKKLRRTMNAKDSSMLYATDNMSIDDFLDGSTPNLYNISGTELYTRGAAAGKAASSRVFSTGDAGRTLGGYYRDYVQKMGYNPDQLNQFQQEMLMNDFTKQVSVLPELQQAASQILEANGVNQNLTGDSLRRAQQQVLRGIIDGAVYSEKHNPIEDKGVISAAQAAQFADNRDARNLNATLYGLKRDAKGNWVKDPNAIPVKGNSRSGSSSSSKSGKSSSSRYTQLQKGVKVEWDDDPTVENATYSTKEIDSTPGSEVEHGGGAVTYDELPQYAKDKVDAILGPEGNVDLHMYYFKPFKRGTFADDEAELEIIPYKVSIFNGQDTADMEGDVDLEGGI